MPRSKSEANIKRVNLNVSKSEFDKLLLFTKQHRLSQRSVFIKATNLLYSIAEGKLHVATPKGDELPVEIILS